MNLVTITLTPELRQRLLKGYESEREGWGDEYTDACIAKLAAIPDGSLSFSDESDDPDLPTDLALSSADFVAIGVDYFGLGNLTAVYLD